MKMKGAPVRYRVLQDNKEYWYLPTEGPDLMGAHHVVPTAFIAPEEMDPSDVDYQDAISIWREDGLPFYFQPERRTIRGVAELWVRSHSGRWFTTALDRFQGFLVEADTYLRLLESEVMNLLLDQGEMFPHEDYAELPVADRYELLTRLRLEHQEPDLSLCLEF